METPLSYRNKARFCCADVLLFITKVRKETDIHCCGYILHQRLSHKVNLPPFSGFLCASCQRVLQNSVNYQYRAHTSSTGWAECLSKG